MQQIIEDNDYISIYKLPKDSILHLVWKPSSSKLDYSEYKTLVLLWANTVQNSKPKGVLVDTREHFVAIDPDLQLWFVNEIFPKYEASGMKKLAFLSSTDFISQLSIEQTMEEDTSVSFHTRYFDAEKDALNWIN